MVYLCWMWVSPSNGNPPTLFAVFGTEAEAREACEQRAKEFANGSGLVSACLMGDSWDAINTHRRVIRVAFQAQAFGPVDSPF